MYPEKFIRNDVAAPLLLHFPLSLSLSLPDEMACGHPLTHVGGVQTSSVDLQLPQLYTSPSNSHIQYTVADPSTPGHWN